MRAQIIHLLAAAATIGLAGIAQAVVTNNTNVDVHIAAGPEFIAGAGVPINGFVQDSVAPVGSENTVSVALKARDRDNGQANAISGNRYYVDPGFSSTNPAISNLAIDFQFDPGSSPASNYLLRLDVDFDPAYGATDFATITVPIFDADSTPDGTFDSWIDSDGYFTTNGGGGTWNDTSVPYVISNTTRQDFSFWGAAPFNKSYDPNAFGEYEYRLTVLDITGTNTLASVSAFAVVPEPASIGLLGIGAIALLRRVRRG